MYIMDACAFQCCNYITSHSPHNSAVVPLPSFTLPIAGETSNAKPILELVSNKAFKNYSFRKCTTEISCSTSSGCNSWHVHTNSSWFTLILWTVLWLTFQLKTYSFKMTHLMAIATLSFNSWTQVSFSTSLFASVEATISLLSEPRTIHFVSV